MFQTRGQLIIDEFCAHAAVPLVGTDPPWKLVVLFVEEYGEAGGAAGIDDVDHLVFCDGSPFGPFVVQDVQDIVEIDETLLVRRQTPGTKNVPQ